MNKKIVLMPLFTCLFTLLHAENLDVTEQIITDAVHATEYIQEEINMVSTQEPIPIPETIITPLPIDNSDVQIIDTLDESEEELLVIPSVLPTTIEISEVPSSDIPNSDLNLSSKIEKNINEEKNKIEAEQAKINEAIAKIEAAQEKIETAKENIETKEQIKKENKEATNMLKGSVIKGQMIFSHHFKEDCNMTGIKFAAKYGQEEWDEIAESGTFKEEALKICPQLKDAYLDEWTPDLYQFSYQYANDSEFIPEC